MPITLANTSITGLGVGGLPAGSVNATTLANGAVTRAKMGYAGAVLQVVNVLKTNIFTTASQSFTDITGYNVSITPTSTASKILILVSLNTGGANNSYAHARVMRGATVVAQGDSDGANRTEATFFVGTWNTPSDSAKLMCWSMTLLDSPNTTSSTNYKVQVRNDNVGGGGLTINAPNDQGTNLSYITRGVSAITLMEIAG